jgi:hypothetical protein
MTCADAITDAYPDVVRLREEIDALKGQMARQSRPDERASAPSAPPASSESMLEVDSELRSLRDDERALREAIAGYEQRVDKPRGASSSSRSSPAMTIRPRNATRRC